MMAGLSRLIAPLGAGLVFLVAGNVCAQSNSVFSGVDWGVYAGEPIEARVGVLIDQLTSIDQKSENFGVVGTIRMEWTDPDFDA